MAKTEFSKEYEQKLRAFLTAWGHEIDYDGPLLPYDLDLACKLMLQTYQWAVDNGLYTPKSKLN